MNVKRVAIVITFNAMLFFCTLLIAGGEHDITEISNTKRSDRIQIPFIGNNGIVEDNEVAFVAYVSDVTVYVKKEGTLTYIFSSGGKNNSSINEIFTPQKITLKPSEPPPEDFMALYKKRGSIPEDLVNYYRMSFGEIYQGVELELMAFTDGFNRLLTLSSGGRTETIKIKIAGSKRLKVDTNGKLEVITDGVSAKFSKPYAYQETDGGRKPVDISYSIIKDTTYGFNVGTYDKKKPLMIHSNMFRGKVQ